MGRKSVPSAGIGPAEEIAGFLWDHRIAAVAADNVALEATSRGSRLHFIAIPLLGLSIGEFWDLEHLADDCSSAGTYDCLLVSAPFYIRGALARRQMQLPYANRSADRHEEERSYE